MKKKIRFFGADKNTKKGETWYIEYWNTLYNTELAVAYLRKDETLRVNLSLTLKRFFLGFGENERLPSRRRRSKLCKHLMHYSKTLLEVNNFLVLLERGNLLLYFKFCAIENFVLFFREFCEFVSLSSSGSSSSTIIRICRWWESLTKKCNHHKKAHF